MEVQVVDALPRLLPDVGYHPVALQPLLPHSLAMTSKMWPPRAVAAIHLRHGGDVGLGDHQKVGGGLGIDVVEGVADLVLIDLVGRDLAVLRSYKTDNRTWINLLCLSSKTIVPHFYEIAMGNRFSLHRGETIQGEGLAV